MVPGVSYDATSSTWKVCSLKQWAVKQQLLTTSTSQEEAEAVAKAYFPLLEAAAAEGSFDGGLAEVKAELGAVVRQQSFNDRGHTNPLFLISRTLRTS